MQQDPDAAAGADPARGDPVGGKDAADKGSGPLTHLDAGGRAHMVDVADKPATARTAVACCEVVMTPATAALLRDGGLPKGDALATTRLAGIQAAKHTWELIPLCHQVALTSVEVDVEVDTDAGVAVITATANAVDRTGVEMEALTAAGVAGLTLIDLVKAVQRDVSIERLRLREKRGGRSGDVVLP